MDVPAAATGGAVLECPSVEAYSSPILIAGAARSVLLPFMTNGARCLVFSWSQEPY